MPRITNITPQTNKDRVNIFVDDQFCCGMRLRTFRTMGLDIGDEISSCRELMEKENFFWKYAYQDVWKKEKVRIERVKEVVEGLDDRITADVVGFGTGSDEIIKEHPEEKGKPDIDIVRINSREQPVIKLEVTGTERKRGEGYWVRPDKLEYAENHPYEDVWIVLHYAEPQELIVFIKPQAGKKYQRHQVGIRGAEEIMCIFNDNDPEIKSLEFFSQHVKAVLK